jgi:endonuclease/exonuclease/phosphatase family metal-dependent hydrolase
MSYNIKSYLAAERPGGFAQLAWEVASHDADVIVMQDATRFSGTDEPLPEPIAFMLGKRQLAHDGQYLIASRFPLSNCASGQIDFRGQDHHYFRCTARIDGSDIDIVDVHFESPREGLNAARHERLSGLQEWQQNFADRLTQSGQLARDLAGQTRPLIIAGDLNAPLSSPVVGTLLGRGLRDAFASAGLGYGYTQGHALRLGFSFLRIDHVLVSATLGVRDSFVGGGEGSEHRPVIADLLVKRD